MNDVKFVVIGFENLESIVIPIERFEKFELGELSLHKKMMNDFKSEYKIYKTDAAHLGISFDTEEELEYHRTEFDEPLGTYTRNRTSNNVQDRPNILGRILNHNDIIDLQTLNENKEVIKRIYVPWKEEIEANNSYMTTKIENKVLDIQIKP